MTPSPATQSERELVGRAVRELARRTQFPVAFGGLLDGGVVSVTSIVGNRTHSLEGLRVRPARGLGGRAILERRPRMTGDYGRSQQITHDYDGFVLGEGLRTLLAIPVVVDGRSRGLLYAGAWEGSPTAAITTASALSVVDALATELRIRDEVDRRVSELAASEPPLSVPQREELRAAFAELRTISALISDPGVRQRLSPLQRRLSTLARASDDSSSAARTPQPVHLSPRETDVLAHAALGSTNAHIAAELGLREATVKAYLGTAMAKLDAATRHAAVVRARGLGLLP